MAPQSADERRVKQRAYYAANREAIRAKNAVYRQEHPEVFHENRRQRYRDDPQYREKVLEQNQAYRLTHPEAYPGARAAAHRDWRARKRGFVDHAAAQGLCEICGTVTMRHWDHDHLTNEFRGWLCAPCNRGLGQFRDDPLVLCAAAEYLSRHLLAVA